jgi:hypothetical protein
MGKRINLKPKIFEILLIGLSLFHSEIKGAPNSGSVIVNNAIGYAEQQ